MLRRAPHVNEMQFEPKSRELKQAVNKRHPAGSKWTGQTAFTLTLPGNDKGSKIPKTI